MYVHHTRVTKITQQKVNGVVYCFEIHKSNQPTNAKQQKMSSMKNKARSREAGTAVLRIYIYISRSEFQRVYVYMNDSRDFYVLLYWRWYVSRFHRRRCRHRCTFSFVGFCRRLAYGRATCDIMPVLPPSCLLLGRAPTKTNVHFIGGRGGGRGIFIGTQGVDLCNFCYSFTLQTNRLRNELIVGIA